LQELATAIEQLAHRAYPAPSKDYTRREAGKAFADGVEDPVIEIYLPLGGEKAMNKALGQAFEPQAVLLVARPQKLSFRTFWGSRSLATGQRDQRLSACCSHGEPDHFQGNYLYGMEAENGRRGKQEGIVLRERQESKRRSEWQPKDKRTGGMANCQEMSGCLWKKGDAGIHMKVPHHML
jgi:hypothetical protein